MRSKFQVWLTALGSLAMAAPIGLKASSLPAIAAPASPSPSADGWLIEAITIEGNRRVPGEAILKLVALHPGARIPRSEIGAMYRRLMASGRFRSVGVALVESNQGHRLVLSIEELPAIQRVAVTGAHASEIPWHAPLRFLEGGMLSDEALQRAREALEGTYRRAGFPHATLRAHQLDAEGTLHLGVEEGRIQAVEIRGNQGVKEALITRELSTRPGSTLRTSQLQADFDRLMRTDLFMRIEPRYERREGDKAGTLILTIEEAFPVHLTDFALGYDKQLGWQLGAGLVSWNLLGTGQQLGSSLFVGPSIQGHAAYLHPWVDDQRTSLGGMVYARAWPNGAGNFREDRTGLHVFGTRPLWGPPLATPFRATAGIRAEQVAAVENYLVGARPVAAYEDGRRVTLSDQARDTVVGVPLELAYDTRTPIQGDERFVSPLDGWLSATGLEPVLVNGVSPLLKATASVTRFFPVPSPFGPATLAFSGRAGSVWGAAVPAYKRFYSADRYHDGWSTSPAGFVGMKPMFQVRGSTFYPQSRDALALGLPMNQFSGANTLVGSLEYRFPIWNVVSGVAFVDYGGFWDQQFDAGLFHVGYGPGLRLATLLGLLRLDLGFSGYLAPQVAFGIGHQF